MLLYVRPRLGLSIKAKIIEAINLTFPYIKWKVCIQIWIWTVSQWPMVSVFQALHIVHTGDAFQFVNSFLHNEYVCSPPISCEIFDNELPSWHVAVCYIMLCYHYCCSDGCFIITASLTNCYFNFKRD